MKSTVQIKTLIWAARGNMLMANVVDNKESKDSYILEALKCLWIIKKIKKQSEEKTVLLSVA